MSIPGFGVLKAGILTVSRINRSRTINVRKKIRVDIFIRYLRACGK